jgi:CubicO group peptidase (beta-lactamase class C family)
LRDGIWEDRRILPEGWVDYTRTPTPQAEAGHYGAHFWIYPGSLGMFYCGGAFGQRTIISPALDLVLVRLGNTSPAKLAAVDAYTKAIIDAFRPTLR